MTLFSHAFSRHCGESYCKSKPITKASMRQWHASCFITSLTFTSIALYRYWIFFETGVVIDGFVDESLSHNSSQNDSTITCFAQDVLFIRTYLIGVNCIVALNLPILMLMIYSSGRGSITETKARQLVAPLLYIKWALNAIWFMSQLTFCLLHQNNSGPAGDSDQCAGNDVELLECHRLLQRSRFIRKHNRWRWEKISSRSGA